MKKKEFKGELKLVRTLKCDPLKDRLSFRFKDLKNPTIEYHASFTPDSMPKKKHWFNIYIQPSHKYIFRDEAWTIFRENTKFEDIYEGARTYDIHDVIHATGIPDFYDYKRWTDTKFLRELSLHPEWLYYSETHASERLIFLLKTAQVANSKKSREALEDLQDYLIPRRQSGMKSYPVNLRGWLFLLKDLSKHISGKCRSFLRYCDINDRYVDLQEWAETEEPRIVGIPRKDLDVLIDRPARFAEIILCQELYVSLSALRSELYK
jgi:hypothetical protein